MAFLFGVVSGEICCPLFENVGLGPTPLVRVQEVPRRRQHLITWLFPPFLLVLSFGYVARSLLAHAEPSFFFFFFFWLMPSLLLFLFRATFEECVRLRRAGEGCRDGPPCPEPASVYVWKSTGGFLPKGFCQPGGGRGVEPSGTMAAILHP